VVPPHEDQDGASLDTSPNISDNSEASEVSTVSYQHQPPALHLVGSGNPGSSIEAFSAVLDCLENNLTDADHMVYSNRQRGPSRKHPVIHFEEEKLLRLLWAYILKDWVKPALPFLRQRTSFTETYSAY
jgi:hypothetical protein